MREDFLLDPQGDDDPDIGLRPARLDEFVGKMVAQLEEDGLLGESLDVEYIQLNLSAAPRITRFSTGEEALAAAGRVPDSMTILKIGLQDLREEVAQMRTDKAIEFRAPTPASPTPRRGSG